MLVPRVVVPKTCRYYVQLAICPDLTDEEREMRDPLDVFGNESDAWADEKDSKDDQIKSGHHTNGDYAPDLPGCYWTGLYDGPQELMMDKPMRQPSHEGNGHMGFMIQAEDGTRSWARIRRGCLELWNDELPENQRKAEHELGTTEDGKFYMEREIVLLNIYTYVKVPEETSHASILLITGTLHIEEFECEDSRDCDMWIESIERARAWAVEKEEMKAFAGVDDGTQHSLAARLSLGCRLFRHLTDSILTRLRDRSQMALLTTRSSWSSRRRRPRIVPSS